MPWWWNQITVSLARVTLKLGTFTLWSEEYLCSWVSFIKMVERSANSLRAMKLVIWHPTQGIAFVHMFVDQTSSFKAGPHARNTWWETIWYHGCMLVLDIHGPTSSEGTVGWQMTDDHACNVLSRIKEGFARQAGLLDGGIHRQKPSSWRSKAFLWQWRIGLRRYSDEIWLYNLRKILLIFLSSYYKFWYIFVFIIWGPYT